MHWVFSLTSKTPVLPLLCQATHKSENCQSPPRPFFFPSPLANMSLYILDFCKAV